MRFVLAWITLVVALVGCATRDPNDYFDADAGETMARITRKVVASVERRPSAEVGKGGLVPIPIRGAMYFVALDNPMADPATIKIYEYSVRDGSGTETLVLSEYFAFEVGDCVKLFVSTRPSYPRIALGWGCK